MLGEWHGQTVLSKLIKYLPSTGVTYRTNSSKYVSIFDFPALTFSANKSCLFKNKITEIFLNHLKDRKHAMYLNIDNQQQYI